MLPEHTVRDCRLHATSCCAVLGVVLGAVLCCPVPCCVVPCCAVLRYDVPCCAVLCCPIFCCASCAVLLHDVLTVLSKSRSACRQSTRAAFVMWRPEHHWQIFCQQGLQPSLAQLKKMIANLQATKRTSRFPEHAPTAAAHSHTKAEPTFPNMAAQHARGQHRDPSNNKSSTGQTARSSAPEFSPCATQH